MDTGKSEMSRFVLYREKDVSGVTSELISASPAVVAEGVLLSNGRVTLTWFSPMITVADYAGMDVVLALHGHGGLMKTYWIDESPAFVETQVYYRVIHQEEVKQGDLTVSFCISSNQAMERAIALIIAKFPGCIIRDVSLLS